VLAGARGRGRTGRRSRVNRGSIWRVGQGGGDSGQQLAGGQRGAAAVGLVPTNWASSVSVDGPVNRGIGKGGWREASMASK
jgi:hypothetical protein